MANDGGLSSFQARMRAIPKAAREAIGPTLVQEARKIAATAKQMAPKKTGDLAESITVTGPGQSTPAYSQPGGSTVVGSNQAAITAGNTDVRYAHLVEFGTRPRMTQSKEQAGAHPGTPAQPFFWPAYRLNRKKALAAIKRGIGKAVRNAR